MSGGVGGWRPRLFTLTGMRRRRAFLAALACLAMVAGACSKGDSKAASGRATTTTAVAAPIEFTVASFDVEAVADPIPGRLEGAQAGSVATLNRWLADAVLRPLRP